uniref:tRNA-specific adenosine deaminase 1 n=1 Tax=Toxoplasma gondii COUG TaxID=1074873 RepID=A0A2G8Y786_TOXGO|nr:adenosine-deaminase domain protein [Toxoplasma gondii COUG]
MLFFSPFIVSMFGCSTFASDLPSLPLPLLSLSPSVAPLLGGVETICLLLFPPAPILYLLLFRSLASSPGCVSPPSFSAWFFAPFLDRRSLFAVLPIPSCAMSASSDSPSLSPEASAASRSLGDRVAECLFSVFASAVPRRGKPDAATGEWTVLAGFALEIGEEEAEERRAHSEGCRLAHREKDQQEREQLPLLQTPDVTLSFCSDPQRSQDPELHPVKLTGAHPPSFSSASFSSSPSSSSSVHAFRSSVFSPLVVATGSRCIGRCRLLPPASLPLRSCAQHPHETQGFPDLAGRLVSGPPSNTVACEASDRVSPTSTAVSPLLYCLDTSPSRPPASGKKTESLKSAKCSRRASLSPERRDGPVSCRSKERDKAAVVDRTEESHAWAESPASNAPVGTDGGTLTVRGGRGGDLQPLCEGRRSDASSFLCCSSFSPCAGIRSEETSSASPSSSPSSSSPCSRECSSSSCDGASSEKMKHRRVAPSEPPISVEEEPAKDPERRQAPPAASFASPFPPQVYRQWTQGSCVCVHDSHAEVLSRRALKRYLVLGMLSQLHAFLGESRRRVLRIQETLAAVEASRARTRETERSPVAQNRRGHNPAARRGERACDTLARESKDEEKKVERFAREQKEVEGGEEAEPGEAASRGNLVGEGEIQASDEDAAAAREEGDLNTNSVPHLKAESRLLRNLTEDVHALALFLLHPFPSSLGFLSSSQNPRCSSLAVTGEETGSGGLGLPSGRQPGRSQRDDERVAKAGDKVWIEFVPLSLSFRTKGDVRLHFYASMAPCGDAAVAPRDVEDKDLDETGEGRDGGDAETEREGDARGAKRGEFVSEKSATGSGLHEGEPHAVGSAETKGDEWTRKEREGDDEGTNGYPDDTEKPSGRRNERISSLVENGRDRKCRQKKEHKEKDSGVAFRFRPTGAKPVSVAARSDERTSLQTTEQDLLSVQRRGLLRFKPGRSDLPSHLRSVSLSCSDKLWSWNCLGWEGAVLSRILSSPLLPFSITVGEASVCLSALKLSLVCRENPHPEGGEERVSAKLAPLLLASQSAHPRGNVPVLAKTTSANCFLGSREAAERRRATETERVSAGGEMRKNATKENRENARQNRALADKQGTLREAKTTCETELKMGQGGRQNGETKTETEGLHGSGSTHLQDRSGVFSQHEPHSNTNGKFAVEHPKTQLPKASSSSAHSSGSQKKRKLKEWEGKCSLPPVRSSGLSIAWHRAPLSEFPPCYQALLSPEIIQKDAGVPATCVAAPVRGFSEAVKSQENASLCFCCSFSSKTFHEVTVGRSGLLHRTFQKRAENCSYLHSELCKANLGRLYLHLTKLTTDELPRVLREALATLAAAAEELESQSVSAVEVSNAVSVARKVLSEVGGRGLVPLYREEETPKFGRTYAGPKEKSLHVNATETKTATITYASLKAMSVEYRERKAEWRARGGGWHIKDPSFQFDNAIGEFGPDPFDFIVEDLSKDS